MPNRVLIQRGVRSVIRVSLPGYDVLSAPLSKIAFDSQFGTLSVLTRGAATMPRSIGNETTHVVGFPEVQSRPPLCLCWFAGSLLDADPTDTMPAVSPNRWIIPGETPYALRVNINASYATFFDSTGSGRRIGYVFLRMLNP